MSPRDPQPDSLPGGTKVVVLLFTASGITHLVRPQVYEPLMPGLLPAHRAIILGSGVAELVCAGGLATRRTWAPVATTATLAVIWVGNWQMALRWQNSSRLSRWAKAVAWARLPLQVPLLVWAWRSPVAQAHDSLQDPSPRTLDR